MVHFTLVDPCFPGPLKDVIEGKHAGESAKNAFSEAGFHEQWERN